MAILPHSTLSEDRVISSLFSVVIDTQRQIYTSWPRGQSDLFTQCCHWHSKADIAPLPFNTIRGQSDLFTVQCCHWHSKADIPPPSTVAEDRVISLLFNVVIETQRQPGQHYQRTEWSLYCSMLTLKGRYTPIQHYQRPEWSLHCSVLTLRLKGRYTPHLSSSKSV